MYVEFVPEVAGAIFTGNLYLTLTLTHLHNNFLFFEVAKIDKTSMYVTHFLKRFYLVKITWQTKFHVLDQSSLFRAFQRYGIAQFSIFFSERFIHVHFEMACLMYDCLLVE